jgi:tetratricopeptide (TPR) repeat protein
VKLAAEILQGGAAHYMSGQMALELNRPQEALEILETFDMNREWAKAWANYWNVVTAANHLLEDHNREMQLAREGYRLNPDRMLMLAWLVRALGAQGRWDEMKPLLVRSEGIRGPDRMTSGTVMLIGARELRRHGHDDEALECLEQAEAWVSSRPTDDPRADWLRTFRAQLLYKKGSLLQKQGSAEGPPTLRQALSEFETLAQEGPLNPTFLGHLGAIHARLGATTGAREMSDLLRELDRPYLLGQHTYWRARIAALLGDHDEAVRLLWQSVGEGVSFGVVMHADPDLEPLHDFAPFQEFIRPKG